MKAILKNLSLSIYTPQVFSVLSIIHRIAVVVMVLASYVFGLTYSTHAFFFVFGAISLSFTLRSCELTQYYRSVLPVCFYYAATK